jgi:alginate O-acetyltransferase complex protein AlgI
MIFTSFEYVLFFAAFLLIRSRLHSFSVEKWFLLIASYVFYMSWSIPCGFLILVTSLIDFYVGVGLGRLEDSRKRKGLLLLSIVANLGVLGFFKYTNFLLANASTGLGWLGIRTGHWQYDILLPAGISFFTFQSMTYTIETYRGKIEPCHSLRDFLLFVAFFPQLLAGPINRAVDLIPQFAKRLRATALDVEVGLVQFGIGAVKKLVISDQIAPNVDLIFASPGNYDSLTLLQGAIGYAIQIYCDFSGYSDMAIGSARILGFRFMENFQMPYSAVTITEFWKRWHISLSTWLRDYLYIPLGGNRKGSTRTYVNLFLTMLLGGLWHGASWNFVFWGALHGSALAIHRGWTAWDPLRPCKRLPWFNTVWSLIARLLTLCVVLLGWVFFRSPTWDGATQFILRMLSGTVSGTHLMSPYILPAAAGVGLVHVMIQKDRQWAQEVVLRPLHVRIVAYSVLVTLLVCLAATDSAPFIYFQF